MKVAKEKVWEDSKGNLVPDGHEDAQTLVAAKGANISDAQVEQYKGGDKFFEDAVFNSDGAQENKIVAGKGAGEKPFTYNMVADHGSDAPQPQNREADMPMAKRGAEKAARKAAAKKTGGK